MVRLFQALAIALLLPAAFFLWQQNRDGVFVCVVLSACSFFMSIRFQAKERLSEQESGIAKKDL
jgi:hypothetical protein